MFLRQIHKEGCVVGGPPPLRKSVRLTVSLGNTFKNVT